MPYHHDTKCKGITFLFNNKTFWQKKCKKCYFYTLTCPYTPFFIPLFSLFTKYVMSEQKRLLYQMQRVFNATCANNALLNDGDHILIGLSGGKDSLLLTELLGRRARIYVPKFTVTAVHVRIPERAYISDTAYLQAFCDQWQVPLHVVDTSILSTETADTKDPCWLCSWYRRKALFEVAQQLGCNKIALGHHRDDVVETLLMNLVFQGRLDSMPPKLQLDKMPIQIIRPLSSIDEKDILAYAQLVPYVKQLTVCPFEKNSSRAQMKHIVAQLEDMNTDFRSSVEHALMRLYKTTNDI